MIDGKCVAVVVPARDEGAWIEEVLATMPPFVDRIIVVDDASLDDTAARASSSAFADRVDVLRHVENIGVGGAIASGYRRAFHLGAEVIAVMAGDGQMDPTELERVVSPIVHGEADYVKGNRLRHPDVWRTMPKARLIGSLVLSRLTGWAVGHRVEDSQCGYTAIGRGMLARLDLDRLWPRFGYPNDLLGIVARAGGRIRDVAVRPVYRSERSRLRAYHVGVILYLIARAAWRRVRSPTPH